MYTTQEVRVTITEFFQYLFGCPASLELAAELIDVYAERQARALPARNQAA